MGNAIYVDRGAMEASMTGTDELWPTITAGYLCEEWEPLGAIDKGSVFVSQGGVWAVKSEYFYSNKPFSQCQCILLASGEYAHFEFGNGTPVKRVISRPREEG